MSTSAGGPVVMTVMAGTGSCFEGIIGDRCSEQAVRELPRKDSDMMIRVLLLISVGILTSGCRPGPSVDRSFGPPRICDCFVVSKGAQSLDSAVLTLIDPGREYFAEEDFEFWKRMADSLRVGGDLMPSPSSHYRAVYISSNWANMFTLVFVAKGTANIAATVKQTKETSDPEVWVYRSDLRSVLTDDSYDLYIVHDMNLVAKVSY